jgi:small subunit ribosomal protein S5
MRLSVFVVVGDYKGNVGVGLGKGADVGSAQKKAVSRAKKNLIHVEMKGNTIPHEIEYKLGATKLILKPAAPGTGLKAGSSVKAVVELAGIKDVLSKLLGSTNSINATYATMAALSSLSNRKKIEKDIESK